jgi:ubiquinone/menaquinone biosynthesis C-methylase UbiE
LTPPDCREPVRGGAFRALKKARVSVHLPYFDVLLERLEQSHPALTTAFGRHVHWGYWDRADQADGSMTDFAQAAERMTRKVCTAAGASNGERILDVGCGWGGTMASLNEQLCGVALTGLNIDARQLERAERLVRARASNVVRFQEGDACAMPFADGSFDLVIALECAFHFPSRPRFLAEAHRVLCNGGRLVIADFLPSRVLRPLLGAQELVLGRYMQHVLGPADASYTSQRYKDAARSAGLLFSDETDITARTLPTYPVLRTVAGEMGMYDATARFGVKALELASRARLLRYAILTFQRDDQTVPRAISSAPGGTARRPRAHSESPLPRAEAS